MREYRYRALTPGGELVAGIRRAPNAAALASQLIAQNVVLLDSRATLGSLGKAFSGAGRAGRRELRDFTIHLATCLGAGIPILVAMRDFELATARGAFRDVIVDIREEVSSGTQVADALERHPEIFSDVYVAMVRAGQDTGNLAEICNELVAYLEWFDDLRDRSRQAMVYPAILVTGVIGLFLLLLLYVIPRFLVIFETADFTLPTLTLRVLGLWTFLRHWWPVLAGAIVAGSVVFGFLRRTRQGRYLIDLTMLRLPALGAFVRKLALARFARHFSLLFSSGTGLLRVLQLSEKIVGNAVLEAELGAIRERVVTGATLTESFRLSPWFPPLIQRLVAVGEKAGSLDTTLLKAAEYYDRELPRALQQAFKILEAVIIAVMGALIAIAALSLLLPILQIRSQLGH